MTGDNGGGFGLQNVIDEPTNPPPDSLDSASTRMRPASDDDDDKHVQSPCHTCVEMGAQGVTGLKIYTTCG